LYNWPAHVQGHESEVVVGVLPITACSARDEHVEAGRRRITILPAMAPIEALATTRIHSVAGLTGERTALVTTRPFRAPHHTISDAGLIGGGHVPLPGEVSLAHNGVLFLDELPEFRRHVLEVLRQPLEESLIYL
jgi:magnesium chelatase family protein